jgi:predicted transglutaminase-like cysteine proteinase
MAKILDGFFTSASAGRRGSNVRAAVLAVVGALSLSACATVPTGPAAMRDGGIVMPPAGWLDFCGRNANDPSCKVVQLDESRWKQLNSVQTSVHAVQQISDKRNGGRAEYWEVAGRKGDCEDIALLARARLLDAGWPSSAVRLATAWTEQGEYHTVLTIDAARNGEPTTLVLDNRFPTVLSWKKLEQVGYRFHMRQAALGPTWVAISS